MAHGLTDKEIAEAMGISPKTVGSHLYAGYLSLDLPRHECGVSNRLAATVAMLKLGIIRLEHL